MFPMSEMTPVRNAQAVVDQLIIRYGRNLPNHHDYASKLATVGLKRSDVTEEMLDLADRRARQYVCDQIGRASSRSSFHDSLHERCLMKVSEAKARQMLLAMGIVSARVCNLKHLTNKLNRLPQIMADGVTEPEGGDLTLMRAVCDALNEGKEIVVTEDKEREPEEEEPLEDTVKEEEVEEKTEKVKKPEKVKKTEQKKPKAGKIKSPAKKQEATAKPAKVKKASPAKPAAAKGKKPTKPKEKKSPEKAAPKKRGKVVLMGPEISGVDAAFKVLQESKEPMNRRQILEAVREKGLWDSPKGKTPEQTLAARINDEIREKGKKARFKKAGRGMFAAAR